MKYSIKLYTILENFVNFYQTIFGIKLYKILEIIITGMDRNFIQFYRILPTFTDRN